MATVIKYPSGRYWIAAFRDSDGRQHRRTTREVDRKRALDVAEKFERVAKRQGSPGRVRAILGEFLRDHYGQELPSTTTREYIERWLATKKAETSLGTHCRYRDAITKFLAFLGPLANRSIEEITSQQITEFRDHRITCSAPGTVNTDLKTIRRIFHAARLEGYLFQNPAEAVKPVRDRTTLKRRPFSIDELKAVLSIANPEWQSLIKFGLYTGQRLRDLASLSWAQIDLERDEIRLTSRKTDKALLIPMATPLREHLLSSPVGDNPKSPVHPRAFEIMQTQHGRVGTLSNQFAEILADTGLRGPQSRRSRGIGRSGKRAGHELSFHSLRHTAVSLLKDAGVPDAVVMALVGHESAAMSARYTHVGWEALAKAARSLPEL